MWSLIYRRLIYRRLRYLSVVEYLRLRLKGSARLWLAPIRFNLNIKPDDILIDCGAHVGDVTSLFARTGATVYAFEPNPVCAKIIARRFRLLKNVRCYQKGAMDRAGYFMLQIPGPHEEWDALDSALGASFTPETMQRRRYDVTEVQIECVDLDDFIRSLGKRVRLLKLDVEGAEVGILNRILDTRTIDLIDFVVAETHERLSPALSVSTAALRRRVEAANLNEKIRLDWI